MEEKKQYSLKRVALKKELIIVALLTSQDYSEACIKAGISESSLYRLLKNPNFIKEFQKVKEKLLADTLQELIMHFTDAIIALHNLMEDDKTPPKIRFNSAKAILDMASTMMENNK